jgi:hypothetical protein
MKCILDLHQISLGRSVRRLLKDLGPTPHDVAENLTKHGVTGLARDGRECAMARYVGAVVGADPSVTTICVPKHVLRIHRRGWPFVTCVHNTFAVTGFVERFDLGSYPLLQVRKPVRSARRQHDAGPYRAS